MKIKVGSRVRTAARIPFYLFLVASIQNCGPTLRSSVHVSDERSTSSVAPPVIVEPPITVPGTLSCATGTHAEGTVCVANTKACTVANGSASQAWNGNSYGPCTVTSCSAGYQNQGNLCVANPPSPVGLYTWGPRTSAQVFISGHSLTDDPLASDLVEIATKRGDRIVYNEQIVLGSPIRYRTRGETSNGWTGYSLGKNRDGSSGLNVVSELRNPQTIGSGQRYDTLVLTENHSSLGMIQWENTVGFARHFHDRLIEGNPAGRTFFYNSWLDVNKNNPANWIDHEKKAVVAWECVTSKINLSLAAAGRQDRVLNLPVGAALVNLVERAVAGQVPGIVGSTPQRLDMLFSDNVHLTPLGVYFVALVNYAGIYGKAPTGITPPAGMNAATTAELQQIAWSFINAYYSRPNPGMRDMASCRTEIAQKVCPSYWTLKGDTGNISDCQNFFGNGDGIFRWPDPSFVAFPAP